MNASLFLKTSIIAVFTQILLAVPIAEAHRKTLAVFGDSIATGAGANTDFDARFASMAWVYVTRGLLDAEGSERGVNFPENSFSTIIASGLGIRPEAVINVAMNGRRVDSISHQFDALPRKTSVYPDAILLSFNGNDACRESVFQTSIAQFRATYLKNLMDGVDGKGGIRRLMRTAPVVRDTSIFLLASLDFPQVLTSPKILNWQVPLHFSKVRCDRFRVGGHADSPRISYLADRAHRMCRGILGTDPKSQDRNSVFRRSHLRQLHEAMVEAQAEAIRRLKTENRNPKLKLYFIEAPAKIAFEGHHVANDCFHLSPQGHNLLGYRIWEEIYAQLQSNAEQ